LPVEQGSLIGRVVSNKATPKAGWTPQACSVKPGRVHNRRRPPFGSRFQGRRAPDRASKPGGHPPSCNRKGGRHRASGSARQGGYGSVATRHSPFSDKAESGKSRECAYPQPHSNLMAAVWGEANAVSRGGGVRGGGRRWGGALFGRMNQSSSGHSTGIKWPIYS
jgi:hypothetical protein